MRKLITIALIAFMHTFLYAQTQVTLQVDMSQVSPSPDTVSVAGNFQVAAGFPSDWTPGQVLLTDQGSGIWSVNLNLPPGSYEYKFINGTAWGQDESVPGICAVNGNRGLTVPATGPYVEPLVCFALCTPCPGIPDTVDVTFRVAMMAEAQANGLSDTVSIAGEIQSFLGASNWTPGASVMTDPDQDSIYEITVRLPEGTYEYKFINGTAWGQDESVPSACGVGPGPNRFVTVTGDSNLSTITSTLLPSYYFDSCSFLPDASVTLEVDMSQVSPPANTVTVAGDFQIAAGFSSNWNPGEVFLTDQGNGIWSTTLTIPQGTYEYKFINGVAWGQDEQVPANCQVNGNRQMVIPAHGNVNIPLVCFGQCGPCQPTPDSVDVTFKVAMHAEALANGLSDTVSIAGSFQSALGMSNWTPGVLLMDDSDLDSIYEVTVRLPEGQYEYKFINGTAWGQDETVPSACAQNNNRFINVSGDSNISTVTDTILPPVYYDSCLIWSAPITTVTLQIDMSLVSPAPDTVTVAGNFQTAAGFPANWQPGEIFLSDNGNGIWSVDVNLPVGTYEYKFINGVAWGDDEIIPAPCAVNGNREMTIPNSGSYTIPLNCFGQCGPCPVFVDTVRVTFRVAMQQIGQLNGLADTVTVAGDFQEAAGFPSNWAPGITIMDDSDQDSIYEVTVTIPEGYYEYKFINGTAWGSDETNIPAACNSGGNRFMTLSGDSNLSTITDTVLPAFYFDSCSFWTPGSVGLNADQDESIAIYPNPFSDFTIIDFGKDASRELILSDLTGKIRRRILNEESQIKLYKEDLSSGFYILFIEDLDSGLKYSRKLVID